MSLSPDDPTQPVILRDSMRLQVWGVGSLLFSFAVLFLFLITFIPSLREAVNQSTSLVMGKWAVRMVALSALSWLVGVYSVLFRCAQPPRGPGPLPNMDKEFVRINPQTGDPAMHDEKATWSRLCPTWEIERVGLKLQAIFFAVALILIAFK